MPAVIKTLDEIINRDERYDIDKITFYTQTDDETLIIPDTNLFDIYFRFIYPYVATLKVTDAEREFFRFRPQILSLYIYGTPSLAWLLLKLNDRECASKFYLKSTMNIIPPDKLPEIFDIIATKSARRLSSNQRRYLRLVGEEVP